MFIAQTEHKIETRSRKHFCTCTYSSKMIGFIPKDVSN